MFSAAAILSKMKYNRTSFSASVFRAVENRRPLIRAANTGISCFIDSSGRLSGLVKDKDEAVFVRGYSVREISLE